MLSACAGEPECVEVMPSLHPATERRLACHTWRHLSSGGRSFFRTWSMSEIIEKGTCTEHEP